MHRNRIYFTICVFVTFIALFAPLFFDKAASFMFLDSINGVPPGTNGHLLGTDTLGRDVFNGIISGTRISLILSILSVGVAVFLAFALNLVFSYLGNKSIKLNLSQCLSIIIFCPFIFYYSFLAFPGSIFSGILKLLILLLANYLILKALSKISKPICFVPLDDIGLKIYEFFRSVPKLILLLILVGLSPKKNIITLAIIIGFLLWPIFFRYIRLEILSEKGNDRFNSLKNLGYSNTRIVFRHFLPLMLPILSTPILFAVISTILLEANLSFLGIGLGDEYVTWGTLLAEARRNTSAWWLIVFPGLCLFSVFMFLNSWLRTNDKLQ